MEAYKGTSQEAADKRYREKIKNDELLRKERNLKSAFRSAKSYVRTKSTIEQLDEFQAILDERRKELLKAKDD